MELDTLRPGQTLFSKRITIASGASASYRDAVEDACSIHAQEGFVPSMAVAALIMSEAMRAVELPPGAVHTGQELQFWRAVPADTSLECSASVLQNSVRQGTRLLSLELRAEQDGKTAISGRASIAVADGAPIAPGEAAH